MYTYTFGSFDVILVYVPVLSSLLGRAKDTMFTCKLTYTILNYPHEERVASIAKLKILYRRAEGEQQGRKF